PPKLLSPGETRETVGPGSLKPEFSLSRQPRSQQGPKEIKIAQRGATFRGEIRPPRHPFCSQAPTLAGSARVQRGLGPGWGEAAGGGGGSRDHVSPASCSLGAAGPSAGSLGRGKRPTAASATAATAPDVATVIAAEAAPAPSPAAASAPPSRVRSPPPRRLGLERSATAKEALDVIVALLEEHGQGGNYYEDAGSCHSFQSAYLIVDCEEAWVLETVGKYWAAEKITEGVRCVCNQLSLTTKIDAEHPELRSYAQSQGWWTGEDEFNFSDVFSPSDDHLACCSGKDSLEKQEESITVQTMIDILRDKASGVCIDSESFLTTASVVSVLPQNRSSPCIHYFTGTPDPSRSIFKPFIFVDDVKLVPKAQSPCFGDNDPARKEPRFQEKPDRRHELYKAHEWARAIIESDEERGQKLRTTMLDLEQQGLEAMEELLSSSAPLDPAEVADLFYDCVDTEIKFFK
uniref:Secernin 1 n=1 Tax=Sus scrofa TaxID=9823 RepID=A0A8D0V1I7_PIG